MTHTPSERQEQHDAAAPPPGAALPSCDGVVAATGTRGGKLVRDLIPRIIRDDGAEPVIYVAGPAEYPGLLLAKLYEELDELAHADDRSRPGELADLAEVLAAYAREFGIDETQLERLRTAKRDERGGFTDRIVWMGNR
ncbi:nucleoside triphosphate pyrophosphohydrolase [Streptomyces sp. NPDC059247]|uniref:nucleoside triphosphate pyrophosphohydrolase n=1 Tax=Streptomyces sp. NPDC059247 TaxID=3346790 RepID=UPI003697D5D3